MMAAVAEQGDAIFSAFSVSLSQLGPFEQSPHLAVAVSGGADSTALCHMAHAWAKARGGRITALTVNHGLRPESAQEVVRVKAALAQAGIECEVLHITVSAQGNIQANARAARYDALTQWCKKYHVLHLLTGHHAQDLAETSLLHQARGATADGASGMACVSNFDGIRILRPMLSMRKDVLMHHLRQHNICWIEDQTNATNIYARNRLRHTGLPADALQHAIDAGVKRYQRDTLIAEDAAQFAAIYPEGYGVISRSAFSSLPTERASLLLANMLRTISGKTTRPRHHETARLLSRLSTENTFRATLSGCSMHADTESLLVMRELSRITPFAIHSASGSARIDDRFYARWQGIASSHYHIAPLGKSYRRLLIEYALALPESVPNVVISSLMALWNLDQLRCIPHIDWAQQQGATADSFRIEFSPPKPLAASAFWCLN
jgi:tRNA(Ile)-lysidine synthase